MIATLATKANSKKQCHELFFKLQTNGQSPLKLVYSMMNLNTIPLPTKTRPTKDLEREYFVYRNEIFEPS
jgi:hypothetical protein